MHRIVREIDALPQTIAADEKAFRDSKGLFASIAEETAAAEKAKRAEEGELAASASHLQERETKLYAIKTQREYQAAVKEIADAKKQNRDREDRILALMEQLEALQKKSAQLEPELADKEKRYQEQLAQITAAQEKSKAELTAIEGERLPLVDQIAAEIMQRYTFIKQRYADPLAKVEGKVCSACSMHLPPQLRNEMIRFIDIKACPSCRRLLYLEEAP